MEYRNCGDCEHYARLYNAYMTAVDDRESALRGLAAAQRELAAYKNAYEKAIFEWRDYGYKDCKNDNQTLDWIEYRVRELLAQEGVPAQPQYREPTLEDARGLIRENCETGMVAGPIANCMLLALKQLGFYRKVQP